MTIEFAETVGAELARLYAEWQEANATAAALLSTRSPGEPLSGDRLEALQNAEARASAIVARRHALVAS